MSLTIGSIAPFGRPTGGSLNFDLPGKPAHLLYLHDLPYRIRGLVDDITVVDTAAARLLHETRLLPRWYFPVEALRPDLLEPSSTVSHCPFKGDARYWHLRVGERYIEDAFWEYPDPLPGAIDLRGLLSPYFEKLDSWLEEEDQVFGHPRDPFHRVDVRRSGARVVVRAGDAVIADTTRALAVGETGMPLRWYVPRQDVHAPALQGSQTSTVCAYKGQASYFDVVSNGVTYPDAVWSYEHPLDGVTPIADHLSFAAEGVDVEVSR